MKVDLMNLSTSQTSGLVAFKEEIRETLPSLVRQIVLEIDVGQHRRSLAMEVDGGNFERSKGEGGRARVGLKQIPSPITPNFSNMVVVAKGVGVR